jgi:LmbE family N-acetylglucosaminyl deacetylase
MHPYYRFVHEIAKLSLNARSLPLGGIPPQGRPKPGSKAPVGLIFSPHPDDECLVGGLALRLMRESGMRIVDVAVTQGSNKARQQERLKELSDACGWLGFEIEQTAPNGLEKITLKTRRTEPVRWGAAVKVIAVSLARHQPRVVFLPHKADWNQTHIGTHYLVMDALETMPLGFQTVLVQTEYWGQMPSPNLMVELSTGDLADLLAALSFHVGEVKRNPYHLRLPAWMQDNVRRGAELVGGQGGAAPDFMFATLYHVGRWRDGAQTDLYAGGRQISLRDSPGDGVGLTRPRPRSSPPANAQ